jgi:hypothetical protein
VVRSQCHDPIPLAEEEGVSADNERIGVQTGKRRKGGVDLACGTGLEDMQLQTLRTRRIRHVSHHKLGIRAIRVH